MIDTPAGSKQRAKSLTILIAFVWVDVTCQLVFAFGQVFVRYLNLYQIIQTPVKNYWYSIQNRYLCVLMFVDYITLYKGLEGLCPSGYIHSSRGSFPVID